MIDILLDKNFDLLIVGGEIATGHADEQHIALLLATGKGDWRQHPSVGCDLQRLLLDDSSPTAVRHEIQEQVELDGAVVESISLSPKIIVKAVYP